MVYRPLATASRFRLYGILVGLVGAVVGGVIGDFVGGKLAFGFTFDWYRNGGRAVFEQADLLAPLFLLGMGLTAFLSPLGSYVTYRVWDRRLKSHRAPPARDGARNRDAQTILSMAGLAVAVGGLVATATYALLYLMAIDLVSPAGFGDVMMIAGAVSGFFAGYLTVAWTADGLASGGIVAREGENFIGGMAVGASKNAPAVVALVLAASLVMGYGVTLIDTDVDVADVLPRGNPNTAAAKNLTEKFKSSFTLQTTFQIRIADRAVYDADAAKHLGQFRVTEPDPTNISDEVYVRAIDEMVEFVLGLEEQGSPFVGTVGLHDFYALINWTAAGGRNAPDSAYELPQAGTPEGEALYAGVDRAVWRAIPDAADAVISPDFEQTALLFTVAPDETMSSKEIGEWALRARDMYVEWAESNPDAYKVFTGENAPLFSVDMPIANAHSSKLAEEDFTKLLPIIAAFILVALFIAFRNWVSIAVAFTSLSLAVVVTFGAMGYLRIPLNTLNMTTLPLIMGVGIDYGIHMMNEYQEMRARGKNAADAWKEAGNGSALALFVATLTTTSGLLVMVVSPSLLIAQLGILAAIAIVSCFLLSVIFIPAFTTVLGGGVPKKGKNVEYTPSVIMPKLAATVSRARIFAVVALLLLAGGAYASFQTIEREPFGDPPRNWLPEDELRQEHEEALMGFYATDSVKANILIFEGDIVDPAAHVYMDAIEQSLITRGVGSRLSGLGDASRPEAGAEGRVISDTLRTLPFLVRTYLTVRDGGPGAGQYLALDGLAANGFPGAAEPYPETREEMEALLEEVHTTPLSGLANLFFDYPDNNMAMMLFSVQAASYPDAEEVWWQVQDALAENEALRPEGLQVAFFGNTAINYLFVAEEVPWLGYMSAATVVIVFVIVLAATRSPKLATVVAFANFLTSLLWIGILPQLGIGLAITLTLPLIFIFAMGSDYTLHMAMRCQKTKDTYGAMATVGKGVLFSFVTTLGAFAIFTQISNLAVRKTMIGTTIAIGVVMFTALMLVPIFYPVKREKVAGQGGTRSLTPAPHGQEATEAPPKKRVIVEMPPPPTRAPRADGPS